MTQIDEVISDMELQVMWIKDHPTHQFPGWMNTVLAMLNAITLLKDQEPRLITSAYFENNLNLDAEGLLPAWIEYRRDGEWAGYWEGTHDEWSVVSKTSIEGEGYRCWTAKPTAEQRKAAKWDD